MRERKDYQRENHPLVDSYLFYSMDGHDAQGGLFLLLFLLPGRRQQALRDCV